MILAKFNRFVLSLATLALFGASAHASLPPQFGQFGSLADATFGGTGIPNDAVAKTFIGGDAGLLGLSAAQRYASPVVTNDGSGRFFAQGGAYPGDAGQLGLWNFNFYIADYARAGYLFELFMDIDPTLAEDFKSFGAGPVTTVDGILQDSWNLGFDAFESGLGYIFDPAIEGEYTFLLTASDGNSEVGRTSIVVEVGQGNSVPEPGTLALSGLALAGLALARRKQQ